MYLSMENNTLTFDTISKEKNVISNYTNTYYSTRSKTKTLPPDISIQIDIIRKITHLDTKIQFLRACQKAGVQPKSFKSTKFNARAKLRTVLLENNHEREQEYVLLNRNWREIKISELTKQLLLESVLDKEQGQIIEAEKHYSRKFNQLIKAKETSNTTNNISFPVYNFTNIELPQNLLAFMRRFSPKCHIMGFKPDPCRIKAETDALGSEVQRTLLESQVDLEGEQKLYEQIRRRTYNFLDEVDREFNKKHHKYVKIQASSLSHFLLKHNLTYCSPDKGKGWVLVEQEDVEREMDITISKNYEEVTKKTETLEQYINYREGVVRRCLDKLRRGTAPKYPATNWGGISTLAMPPHETRSITDREYTDANTQASTISHLVPLAKIHKFSWLTEAHGDGRCLVLEPSETN